MTPFRYRRRVQFYETDLAGIVHFSWYLRYVEEAEHAMWRAAGLSIQPADHAVGFPRVSASIDFQAPLRFEDEIEVRIEIEALRPRTIRYAATIWRGDTQVATAAMTAVCISKRPGDPLKAIEIPAGIAQRLAAMP